jgi:hypothetical protein
MKLHRIALACAAAALFATVAQARSYDCAGTSSDFAPEGIWSLTEGDAEQMLTDLSAHPPAEGEFLPRFCGVIENGQRMILIGALHVTGDDALCDDAANFALFYDPRARSFGAPISGQTFCARGRVFHRPTP